MKQRRGFALIPSDRMRTIASAGGQAAARSGHAYKFTGAVARTAGKLGAEVRMAPWWSDSSGRVSLRIILDDALPCTRAGAQDATVHALSHKPYVHRQLRHLDAADVRAALRPWGAWTEYELRDHAANLQRVLWLAACEIAERKGML